MNQWMNERLTHPYLRLAIEELCHEHPDLKNPEALEDFLDYAGGQLPRMAQNEHTAGLSPLQGLRRLHERWLDNRAHPDRHYSEQIAELARGRQRENPSDYTAEPDVHARAGDGIEADLDAPEDHLTDRRSAIADMRAGRAGEGGGRQLDEEQRRRMAADAELRRRRA